MKVISLLQIQLLDTVEENIVLFQMKNIHRQSKGGIYVKVWQN